MSEGKSLFCSHDSAGERVPVSVQAGQMSNSSNHELVTVATYWDPMEAQIARLRLAHAGVPAFLDKEFTVQMAWHYTNAVGGVRLVIPRSQFDEACRLLSSKDLFSDWKDSRPWEWGLNGVQVVVEDEETAAARDLEFKEPLSPREELARRALTAAILGMCWEIPLLFATGHLFRFYNASGRCRSAYRQKAQWAWWLVAVIWGNVLLIVAVAWAASSLQSATLYDETRQFSPPINALRP